MFDKWDILKFNVFQFPRSEEESHLRSDIVRHLSLLCYHFPVTPSIGPVKYYDVSHSASVISTLASMTAPPTLGLSADPGFCSDYSGTSTVYSTAPNRYPIAHSMEVQSSDTALLAQPIHLAAFIKHHSLDQPSRPNTFPLEPNLCVLGESTKDVVSKLKCAVEEQKQQLRRQEMKIEQQQSVIRQLETQLKDVEGRFCNGVYIWRIRDYHQKRKEAVARKAVVHHSPGFYTSPHGYKMCIRANLNGVETATGSHLSLFVHLMQGEFDEILSWPFQGCIILSILDQSGERRDISETLLAKPGLAAFLKPTSKRNNKGFGYIEFAPLTCFSGDRYIRNDTMLVKVVVKPDELVSSSLVTWAPHAHPHASVIHTRVSLTRFNGYG